MNNTFLVGCCESFTNVPGDRECVFDWNRTTSNAIGQRFAFDKLEHEVSQPIRLLDVVDAGDVWMVQRCQQFSFTLKSAHPLAITRELIGQNLDRDIAL